jgi:hypothetical protein
VGDGIEDTYFRRPVVSADDIAAIAPVMLGSGANLLGYYMFHTAEIQTAARLRCRSRSALHIPPTFR